MSTQYKTYLVQVWNTLTKEMKKSEIEAMDAMSLTAEEWDALMDGVYR